MKRSACGTSWRTVCRSDASSHWFVRLVCESRVNTFPSYVSAACQHGGQHNTFVFRATEQLDLVWQRLDGTERAGREGGSRDL